MNRIIREHYPAAKLPEDLRGDLNLDAEVTVTVVQESSSDRVMSLEQIFTARRPPYRTAADIDAQIEAARDEWDARG